MTRRIRVLLSPRPFVSMAITLGTLAIPAVVAALTAAPVCPNCPYQ